MTIRSLVTATAVTVCGLFAAPAAFATPLNIDFGNYYADTPSSSLGAASGQTGSWNRIADFSTPTGVVDIFGNATSVTIEITASNMTGAAIDGITEADLLMRDAFFVYGATTWSLAMAGLTDGTYDVYLYDLKNPNQSTGSGSLNGVAIADIEADFNGTFLNGGNYQVLSGVVVTGGLLNASAGGDLNLHGYGLAGMQIVERSSESNDIPEPATLALFGLGLAGLAFRRKFAR